MELTSEERDYLAAAIYGEARGEIVEGQQGVAWTIINRARITNQSIRQVVLDASASGIAQYSAFHPEDHNRADIERAAQEGGMAWRTAQAVAEDVLSGRVPDPTNGAMHYYAPDTMRELYGFENPDWGRGHNGWREHTVIGGHVFGRAAGGLPNPPDSTALPPLNFGRQPEFHPPAGAERELNRARYEGSLPPNPVPHPYGPNTPQEGVPSPDADTIRRRLDQGFDRMNQDLGPPVVDPRFEPILNRLTPEQMDGLRTELDEVRAQNRRQSDYDAATLQERMARSLQGLRESGRPDDDLDDAGILNTLGEEGFADYARQRNGARRYHHAVAGMESLPDHEIEARMVALRSAKAVPGDEGAALQSDVARHVQALRAERQTDPAMAVRRIPEMKQAESELNPDDRESVSAFVGEGLRWQAVQGIAPSAQRAVPRELAQTLADGILAQQADARRDGVRPAVAMRASIEGIRNVFGDAHARSVMNSAFAEMRGADHLASMARQMFDRDEMGGMMPSAVPQMMPPVAYGKGAGGPALKPMGRAV